MNSAARLSWGKCTHTLISLEHFKMIFMFNVACIFGSCAAAAWHRMRASIKNQNATSHGKKPLQQISHIKTFIFSPCRRRRRRRTYINCCGVLLPMANAHFIYILQPNQPTNRNATLNKSEIIFDKYFCGWRRRAKSERFAEMYS